MVPLVVLIAAGLFLSAAPSSATGAPGSTWTVVTTPTLPTSDLNGRK